MKTIIVFLLLTTSAFAQNLVTGSLEYEQKPVESCNTTTNALTVQHQQKISARLSATYKVKDVSIMSTSSVNLSDIRDISLLLNFSVPLP